MRKWKGMFVGMATGLALSAAVYAQQKSSVAKTWTYEDYAEIERLYARYNWALDSHADNGAVYAKLFTADGEFNSGTETFIGRDRLAVFGAGRRAAGAQSPRHYATNIVINSTPEGARGSAYLLYVTPSEAGKPATVVTGTYDDTFVKTSQGWRFKRRVFGNDMLMPDGVRFLDAH